MIPVAIGMAFTPWALSGASVVAIVCALLGGGLALLFVRRRRRFTTPAMIGWAVLYAGFIGYVLLFGT